MARSTVAQRVQIGRETTPGTAAAANKRLGSLSLALSPSVESEARRTKGSKYPTVVVNNKEWAEGDLEGTATYDEIVYPLASVFDVTTPTQIMDGATATGAYQWVFSPETSLPDTPVTYTVEEGDGTTNIRTPHVLFTDFGLEISRENVEVSGSVFAQQVETGVTLTASPTDVAADMVPILPGQVCVYMADTHAGLGAVGASTAGARLGKALSINPSIGGRYNPVWYLNCTLDSFGDFVEAPEPDFTADFMVEADAAGLAWIDRYRSGETQFMRVEAKGPVIYTGGTTVNYLLAWDFAVKVLEPGEQSDEDGIYAISPSLQVVHDNTWGRATKITVINTVSAL